MRSSAVCLPQLNTWVGPRPRRLRRPLWCWPALMSAPSTSCPWRRFGSTRSPDDLGTL